MAICGECELSLLLVLVTVVALDALNVAAPGRAMRSLVEELGHGADDSEGSQGGEDRAEGERAGERGVIPIDAGDHLRGR